MSNQERAYLIHSDLTVHSITNDDLNLFLGKYLMWIKIDGYDRIFRYNDVLTSNDLIDMIETSVKCETLARLVFDVRDCNYNSFYKELGF